MIQVVAVLFALGFGWLTEFLWAEYITLALGTEIILAAGTTDAAQALIDCSHILLAGMIGLLAVAPALKTRDFTGVLINSSSLSLMVGLVLTGFAQFLVTDVSWVTSTQNIALITVFSVTHATLAYSASILLVGGLVTVADTSEDYEAPISVPLQPITASLPPMAKQVPLLTYIPAEPDTPAELDIAA